MVRLRMRVVGPRFRGDDGILAASPNTVILAKAGIHAGYAFPYASAASNA